MNYLLRFDGIATTKQTIAEDLKIYIKKSTDPSENKSNPVRDIVLSNMMSISNIQNEVGMFEKYRIYIIADLCVHMTLGIVVPFFIVIQI